jgi:hypothetical protein
VRITLSHIEGLEISSASLLLGLCRREADDGEALRSRQRVSVAVHWAATLAGCSALRFAHRSPETPPHRVVRELGKHNRSLGHEISGAVAKKVMRGLDLDIWFAGHSVKQI